MKRVTFRSLLALAVCVVFPLHAEDKPAPEPAVTALVPLAVQQGFSGTLRLRGFQMKDATEVRIDGSAKPDKLEIKEKKDAGAPTGMEADLLGKSEVVIELTLPADFPVGALSLIVAVDDKTSKPVTLQVLPAAQSFEEKEPNKGFRESNKIALGQSVTGLINGQRDVDVFEIEAKAGQPIKISVNVGNVDSLLDPLLTIYDAQGVQLSISEGAAELTPANDGSIFLTLQDAHDFGSEWHSYRLLVEAAEEQKPSEVQVSFALDVWPVLRANCVSCHRPAKLKGGLDMTSFAAISKGGKHGEILKDDVLIDTISGPEPEMPAEGEPLTAEEVALLSRWVEQGSIDDTPAEGLGTKRPIEPPVYRALPAVPAIAFSPNGEMLAIAAHHEIIIHRGDGSGIIGRWPGDSRRIEALQFSRDGRFLAACGGAASEFGEIQIWDVAAGKLVRSIRVGSDTLYGVSWSDDGARLAVGGADKLVRAFDSNTGDQVMQCDNHLDWVFGTAFVHDGSKLVSVSRDRAVKLIDLASGHLIDDAASPREPVLAIARHPQEDIVAYTGNEGKVRLHKMAPRGGRLKEGDNKEESAIREFEHMSTSLYAVAFSPDGSHLACGGLSGEVRIFQTDNGQRKVVIPPAGGPIFSLAFHPKENQLVTAGDDGKIRIYDATDGKILNTFAAVPLTQ
jgi:mono/diheme cytochrome c family protein